MGRTGRSRSGEDAWAQPHVLREYAVVADGERGAVLGPHGDLAWMCVPRWDSPSVFSTLIGGSGVYSVTPTGRYVWGGSYDEGSMIWRSRWATADGIVQCREALAYPGDPHRAVMLRQVHALDAAATVEVLLRPRAEYDRARMRDLRHHRGTWTARVGPLWLRWNAGPGVRRIDRDGALVLHLRLQAGERRDLVLEIGDEPLPDQPPEAEVAWRTTQATWESTVPPLEHLLSPSDSRRSYAVLAGLTSSEGGMVAAATTSLPERAEAGRNYDYRYVWIRDQCFAGQAAAAVGADPLLDSAVRVVAARLLEHGDQLAPAYTTTGAPVPSPRHLELPGYPGGSDIAGNQVNRQFQLDAYGEALLLLAAAARRDRLDADAHKAIEVAVATIERRWNEPDAGIWELDDRPWTHSRLIAAAGLRAVAAALPEAKVGDRLALADRIVAHTTGTSLHADGRWQRTPDDPGLDAALLTVGLRGAVPVDDPRTRATLDAYLRELTQHGYAYRFRHDDRPLPDAEGSFLLCGFLVALALHDQGENTEARAWFERTRAACGPPQLFSEEYDSQQNQMRGNLPQAFVHALMIESAARLAPPD